MRQPERFQVLNRGLAFEMKEPIRRSLTEYATAIEICSAGLKMSAASGMRDLALRLLAYETAAGAVSEPVESPTLRVYEKLRHSLGEFVGSAGFQSLASRALILARPETPSLNAVSITESGSLQGLGEIAAQFDLDSDPPGEAGIILIARLLSLLRIFLGEALTLSLLQNAWSGEALDERDSENGREA